MKTYAIYRGLYGADFIRQSIESVLPHVDKVIFVFGVMPWSGVTEWTHKGKRYVFPQRFDELPDIVRKMAEDDDRIEFVEHYSPSPRGQISDIVNNVVVPRFGRPDIAMFMMSDHVWDAGALKANLDEFETSRYRCANTWQIETWRGLNWRFPERHRAGVGFWNLRDAGEMPETALDFNPATVPLPRLPMLGGRVHNLRYSQNPNVMFWRHCVISAYSNEVGDSTPDPDHFEKWLNWTPETRDLEMSLAHKHTVPQAVPYDTQRLPEVIHRDLETLQKQISNETWKGYPACE